MQSAKQARHTPQGDVNNDPINDLNIGLAPKEKAQVAKSFSQAAQHYDRFARLQQGVVEKLCGYLDNERGQLSESKDLLDIGCGTADVYKHLSDHIHYTGLDISTGMLAQAETKYPGQLTLVLGDAEALPFSDQQFDIVCSSLAVQWCDLTKVLKEAYRVLKPGGKFVFSTLLAGTLAELNTAWHAIDHKAHVNHFLSQTSLECYTKRTTKGNESVQSELSPIQIWSKCEHVYDQVELSYSSALAVMRELKAIGANKIVQAQGNEGCTQSPLKLTKGTLARLEAAYPKKKTKMDEREMSYATWKLAYITMTK